MCIYSQQAICGNNFRNRERQIAGHCSKKISQQRLTISNINYICAQNKYTSKRMAFFHVTLTDATPASDFPEVKFVTILPSLLQKATTCFPLSNNFNPNNRSGQAVRRSMMCRRFVRRLVRESSGQKPSLVFFKEDSLRQNKVLFFFNETSGKKNKVLFCSNEGSGRQNKVLFFLNEVSRWQNKVLFFFNEVSSKKNKVLFSLNEPSGGKTKLCFFSMRVPGVKQSFVLLSGGVLNEHSIVFC